MASLLSRAAAELALRTEVESTLTSILRDVEHAHALGQSLEYHDELRRCRRQLEAFKVRYDDREAAWEADRREKERLGMVLLEEIVKLSARETNAEKKRGKDAAVELHRPEEEGRVADERVATQKVVPSQQQQHQQQLRDTRDDSVDYGRNIQEDSLTQKISIPDQGMNKVMPSEPISNGNKENLEGSDRVYSAATNNAPDDKASSRTKLPATAEKNTTHESNLLETSVISSFVPHKLDEATLMNIFGYVDPIDVMSFAHTNKALLSKVNVMFGVGGGGEEEGDASEKQQLEQSSALLANQPQMEPLPLPVHPTPSSTPIPIPFSPTIAQIPPLPAPASATLSTSGAKSSPKLFGGIQGPSSHHRRQGSSTSVSTAGSGGGNPFSQVFSRFGGSTSITSDTMITSSPSLAPGAAESEIKFNAAMANSMASKLTPAELSIILRMRERLQQCEADANKWRLEKEDAVANLDSVKAVKEFLVNRVRDTEKLVEAQKEEMKLILKKNMEDQEVIVYLDERVKDLEKVVKEMKSNEEATKENSAQIIQKHEKKVQVLSDMLRFEREQTAANENEWKIAKKLLVKEVKNCRARVVALEAEAEGYRRENSQLKHGLAAVQSTGSMSPRGKK